MIIIGLNKTSLKLILILIFTFFDVAPRKLVITHVAYISIKQGCPKHGRQKPAQNLQHNKLCSCQLIPHLPFINLIVHLSLPLSLYTPLGSQDFS